ncbi:MAG: translocation/assembly module TamB, partial [Novosphingobium sp.]|nr:translocation/assembly module TamB [Novosphingobium sp.]
MGVDEASEPQGEPEVPVSRTRSRGRYVVSRLLGLFLAAIVLALVVLDTPIGHRFVADRIAALTPENGLRIKVARIEGSVYSQATLRGLTLSDPKGPFLTVPVAELDWRPLHWFFSGLDIRELTARRGTLLRFPELKPSDPNKPLLPDFDIRVDRFRLDDFTVAEGVLGEKRRIDLTAKAKKRPGRALLRVDGKLGGADRLHVLLDSDPDRDRFDLDVDYMAPRGGLLAGLVGSGDDMQLRIAGDGTWSDWKGTFLARQDKRRLAAFTLTNRKGRYGMLGQVYPAKLVHGTAARLLGTKVSLGGAATFKDSVLDGDFRLQGHAIDMTAKGALDLAANAAEGLVVTARLTRPDALGKGLRIEGARLTARLDGQFGDLAIPHDLRIDRIDAGTRFADIRQQGVLQRKGTRWTLPLNLAVATIETGNGTADSLLKEGYATGTLELADGRLLSDELKLVFPGLEGRFSLRGDTAKGGYALAGPVDARGLVLENIGTLDGEAKVLAKLAEGGGWMVKANLAARMPQISNGTVNSLTGGGLRLRGGVTLGSGRPVLFEDVALDAAKLELRLDGSVADGGAKLAGTGKHADYGSFTLAASVADDGPRAELVFADPLPAAGLKDVRIALAPITDGFGIDTAGQSVLGPFDGRLNLLLRTGEPTRLAVERLAVSQAALSGALTLGDGGASGKLVLAGGGLDGAIVLAPRGGGQGFELALDAKNARFAGTTPTLVRSAHIEGKGVLGGERAEATGSVYAQGIIHGQLFIGRFAARGAVADGKGTFNASVAGRRGSRFSLQLQGATAPERITLVAQGEFADQRIAMPRRAVLTRSDGGWQLAPTQVSYGDGMAIAEGRFGGDGPTDIKLHLADMSLSLFDIALTDLSLGGKVSGIVDFHEADGTPPSGKARLAIEGLTRSGLVLTSRPVDLYLVAELSPQAMQARAAIREGSER